jgi:hypothetical protein
LIAWLLAAASQPAAVELRRLPAPEARQGVVADARSVYAIDNSTIARYDKITGERIGIWRADPTRFSHLNSCSLRGRVLVCANSNYPNVPMASSIVWVDSRNMTLQRVRDLGRAFGSLTWIEWKEGNWWACFAHYDGRGGEAGFDHRATALVRYDAKFNVQAIYRFPDNVLARFAPRSSSGGAWASDGLLYVTGHDKREIYALALPTQGDTLTHVATLTSPTAGQAIAWDKSQPRILWSIERTTAELVASKVPLVVEATGVQKLR